MYTSEKGIDFIKKFEGCVLKVYLDVVGVKTLGYGHTGDDVNAMPVGTPITKEVADAFLRKDLAKFEQKVNRYDHIYHWTQNEFDALVSFAYNVGNIDQLTNNGTRSKSVIADKMLEYNKAKKKVIDGLTNRRKAERQMFLKGNSPETKYKTGNTYTLKANLYVRNSSEGEKVKFDALTENAKAHGHFDEYGYAILEKGTRVTCREVDYLANNGIWLRIPSGWVCARKGDKVYIE